MDYRFFSETFRAQWNLSIKADSLAICNYLEIKGRFECLSYGGIKIWNTGLKGSKVLSLMISDKHAVC